MGTGVTGDLVSHLKQLVLEKSIMSQTLTVVGVASQKALTGCQAFRHTNFPGFSHQLQGHPRRLDLFSHMWC